MLNGLMSWVKGHATLKGSYLCHKVGRSLVGRAQHEHAPSRASQEEGGDRTRMMLEWELISGSPQNGHSVPVCVCVCVCECVCVCV